MKPASFVPECRGESDTTTPTQLPVTAPKKTDSVQSRPARQQRRPESRVQELDWREINRLAVKTSVLLESLPTLDIRLTAKRADFVSALRVVSEFPADARRCLLEGLSIPVLIQGRSVSNSFGQLGPSDFTWRPGAVIPIRVEYRDFGHRRYVSRMHLLLADSMGFAQSFWASSASAPK